MHVAFDSRRQRQQAKAKMPDRSHVVINSTYIAAASTVGAGAIWSHGWAIHVWVGAVSLVAGIVSYRHGQPSTRLSSVQHLLASCWSVSLRFSVVRRWA